MKWKYWNYTSIKKHDSEKLDSEKLDFGKNGYEVSRDIISVCCAVGLVIIVAFSMRLFASLLTSDGNGWELIIFLLFAPYLVVMLIGCIFDLMALRRRNQLRWPIVSLVPKGLFLWMGWELILPSSIGLYLLFSIPAILSAISSLWSIVVVIVDKRIKQTKRRLKGILEDL